MFFIDYTMATFTGRIANGNGYTSQDVTVSGVINQVTATKALEARYPGAVIRSVRLTSNKN